MKTEYQQCDAAFSTLNFQGDPGAAAVFRHCDGRGPAEMIIWPVNCADMAQDLITSSRLSGIDGHCMTSINPLCPVKGGVAFWVVRLTPIQVATLVK